jgi:hypothetical protein
MCIGLIQAAAAALRSRPEEGPHGEWAQTLPRFLDTELTCPSAMTPLICSGNPTTGLKASPNSPLLPKRLATRI